MTRAIIVTCSNDAFFPFAQDLVASLRDKIFAMPFDIGVLDIGLTPEQSAWFQNCGVKVCAAARTLSFPNRAEVEAKSPGFRALQARLFIPETFPDYDVYGWMDADLWVQTTEALDSVLPAAARNPILHIAPEFDRCYRSFFESTDVWNIYSQWYVANCDPATAKAMLFKPMFNAGFFVLSGASPLWRAWREAYEKSLQNVTEATNKSFMADQLELNILLYLRGVPHEVLPASFNWLTVYALPMIDPKTGFFVEPALPHRPLAQIHLTRPIKAQKEKILCVGGGEIECSLMMRARPTLRTR